MSVLRAFAILSIIPLVAGCLRQVPQVSPVPVVTPVIRPTPSPVAQRSPIRPPNATPSPAASTATVLLEITASGGLCPLGTCSSTKTLNRDGTYVWLTDTGQTVRGRLPAAQVESLAGLIATADFASIRSRPFTKLCPTAYDGQEITYAFATPLGVERVSSCQTEIDYRSPLFTGVQTIDQAITSSP